MSDLDVGWALRAASGQHVCGDAVLHVELDGLSLLGLVDGVGHGPRAAAAASAATSFIRANPERELTALLSECDGVLRHTCGVAMTLLRIRHSTLELEHVGVGNVELATLTRERIAAITQPGLLGRRLRKVVVTRHQLHPGDILALHSDGISRRLQLSQARQPGARQTAEAILDTWGQAHDDAGCVVVFLG